MTIDKIKIDFISSIEDILKPKYMNDAFSWAQIKDALKQYQHNLDVAASYYLDRKDVKEVLDKKFKDYLIFGQPPSPIRLTISRGEKRQMVELPSDATDIHISEDLEEDILVSFRTKFGGKKYLQTYITVKWT